MVDVALGPYSVPALLAVFLMLIYNYIGEDKISNRQRPLIAIALGIILSFVALKYKGLGFTFINVIDYLFYGILQGASAIGLYEGQKAIRKKKLPGPVLPGPVPNTDGQGGAI